MCDNFKINSGRFGSSTAEEMKLILQQHNAKNTNKATKCSVTALREYLKEKDLPILEEILDCDLPDLLEKFYVDACKKKSELDNTQSIKKH